MTINYTEPPSGDERLDAGAIDPGNSNFVAICGIRTSMWKAGRKATWWYSVRVVTFNLVQAVNWIGE